MSGSGDLGGEVLVLGATEIITTGLLLYVVFRRSATSLSHTISGVMSLCKSAPKPVRITAIKPEARRATNFEHEVEVTGTGFADGITIKFDQTSGRLLERVSASKLRAMSPGGLEGEVDVVVANPDGGSDARDDLYEYVVLPEIDAITPVSGPASGGTEVTVTGKKFHASAEVAVGDAKVKPKSCTTTEIKFDTPPHAAGKLDVVVHNPVKQKSNAEAFEFLAPPRITRIEIAKPKAKNPTIGVTSGGETMRITGTDFHHQATVSFDDVAFNGTLTFNGTTSIDLTTPVHKAQKVAVTVANPDTQSHASDFFFADPPVIDKVAILEGPNSAVGTAIADTAGKEKAQVDGKFFDDQTLVNIGGQRAKVLERGATTLVVETPALKAGDHSIQAVNGDGEGLPSNDNVTLTYAVPPEIASATVTEGNAKGTSVTVAGGNETIEIIGKNFVESSVTIGGANADVTSVAAKKIVAKTPARDAGARLIVVTNQNGQHTSQSVSLTYAPPPVVKSVKISAGSAVGTSVAALDGGETAVVEGTDFDENVTVSVDGKNAAVQKATATELTITTPKHDAGARAVQVRNPNGLASNTNIALTYAQPPKVTAVSISAGLLIGKALTILAGAETATVTGTGFDANATVWIDGTQGTVTDNSKVPTELTFTTPQANAGKRQVVVKNANGQQTTDDVSLTYAAPPVVDQLDPVLGTTAGGKVVKIKGSNFVDKATVTFDTTDATNVDFVSDTELHATTPQHWRGDVAVTVTNPDGLHGIKDGAFVYMPPPLIVAVLPPVGPAGGDIDVFVVGRFLKDGVVRFGGKKIDAKSNDGNVVKLTSPKRENSLDSASTMDVIVTTDYGTNTASNAFTLAARPPTATVIYPDKHNRTSIPQLNSSPETIAPWLTDLHEGREPSIESSGKVGKYLLSHKHTPGMQGILWSVLEEDPWIVQVLDHALSRGPANDNNNYQCNLVQFSGGYWFYKSGNKNTYEASVENAIATYEVKKAALDATPIAEAIFPSSSSPPGGGKAKIFGVALDKVTEVFINRVSATIASKKKTELVVEVPAANAGTYDVEVRNAAGNGNRLANAFTYAALSLSSVAPDQVDQAGDEAIYIIGTGFSEGNLEIKVDNAVQNGNWRILTPTIIDLEVPAHAAGTVNVAVRDTKTNVTAQLTLTYV